MDTTVAAVTNKQIINGSPLINAGVTSELKGEINSMLSFALNNGLTINNEINGLLESTKLDDLLNVHSLLTKNVQPATPKSINYLNIINDDYIKGTNYKNISIL